MASTFLWRYAKNKAASSTGYWNTAINVKWGRKIAHPSSSWVTVPTHLFIKVNASRPFNLIPSYLHLFSDQIWKICMEFGKSATNFDIPTAESCPTGRRTVEPPKLPALSPKCMHCCLNWSEKRCMCEHHRYHLRVRDYLVSSHMSLIVMHLWDNCSCEHNDRIDQCLSATWSYPLYEYLYTWQTLS